MNNDPLKERRFRLASESRTFKNIVQEFTLGNKKVLDLGCSYGEYTAHFDKDSVGITTNTKEVVIGNKRGLDIRLGNVEDLDILNLSQGFEFIWANNLFEHLRSPHAFLVHLKKVVSPESILILGVPVLPQPYFLTKIKKFSGAFSDAHINFFTAKTLKHTVEAAGWKVINVRSFVFKSKILDRMTTSFIPHIYIVAKQDASFAYSPGKLQEWRKVKYYSDLLKITGQE